MKDKKFKPEPDWMDCYEEDCSTIQDNPVKYQKDISINIL